MSTRADRVLDLGEKGCGQLLMEILFVMRELTAGQTLLVTAYDPAAHVDIVAWCNMTGNRLLQALPETGPNRFLLQKGM